MFSRAPPKASSTTPMLKTMLILDIHIYYKGAIPSQKSSQLEVLNLTPPTISNETTNALDSHYNLRLTYNMEKTLNFIFFRKIPSPKD